MLAATRGVEAAVDQAMLVPEAEPVAAHARLGGTRREVTENGIARTVFRSSVGAEKRHGAGRSTGWRGPRRRWTPPAPVLHLRAGYFFCNLAMDLDGLREGVLRTAMALDATDALGRPADIAEVAAGRCPRGGGRGRRCTGRDLMFAQVAEVLTDVLGRRARQRIADDDLRASLGAVGLGEAQVEAIVGMSTGRREGFVAEQLRRCYHDPSMLGGWAQVHLRPLLR